MIAIAEDVHVRRGTLPKRELTAFVRGACAAISLHGEVSILLTTDAALREMNRAYRRKDKPTDVLSFPAISLPGSPPLAGDLAISLDTAGRQAQEFGHALLLEVKVLLLHGLLHLAGLDHEQDTGQMARRERALRAKFDLPTGVIQRAAPALRKSATNTVTEVRAKTATPKEVVR
jgi:probable rRNA maturation factor